MNGDMFHHIIRWNVEILTRFAAPEVRLTPIELKRLGLTPGSVVWKALVEGQEE
jgi:hypothetical protein